jgi:hypothetical protein
VKSAAKKPANPEKDAAAKKLAEKQKLAAAKQKFTKQRAADRARATKERQQLKLDKKAEAAAAKEAKRTPEQIARREKRLRLADTFALKKTALQPPSLNVNGSAYGQFTAEKGKELSGLMQDAEKGTKTSVFVQHSKNVSAAYKELSPADLEVGPDPGRNPHGTRRL